MSVRVSMTNWEFEAQICTLASPKPPWPSSHSEPSSFEQIEMAERGISHPFRLCAFSSSAWMLARRLASETPSKPAVANTDQPPWRF